MLALARPGNPIPPVNDHCFGVSKLGIRFHNHLAFRFQIFIIHVNVLYTMFPPASCEHLVSNPHERTRRILNIIQKIGWQIPCLSHLFPRLRRDICQLGTNVSEASNETVICLCRGLLHTKAMLALGGSPLHARYRQRFPRHARCRQEALDHPDEAGGRTDWHPGGCVSVLVHRNLAGRFTPPCIYVRGMVSGAGSISLTWALGWAIRSGATSAPAMSESSSNPSHKTTCDRLQAQRPGGLPSMVGAKIFGRSPRTHRGYRARSEVVKAFLPPIAPRRTERSALDA